MRVIALKIGALLVLVLALALPTQAAASQFETPAGCDAARRPHAIYDVCADQRALYAAALASARADGRRLAVIFGATWCPSCRSLKPLLSSPALIDALGSRLQVLELAASTLDRGRVVAVPTGTEVLATLLARQPQTRQRAVPFLVVVDPASERVLARNLDDLERNWTWDLPRLIGVLDAAERATHTGGVAPAEPNWIRRKWQRWWGG